MKPHDHIQHEMGMMLRPTPAGITADRLRHTLHRPVTTDEARHILDTEHANLRPTHRREWDNATEDARTILTTTPHEVAA